MPLGVTPPVLRDAEGEAVREGVMPPALGERLGDAVGEQLGDGVRESVMPPAVGERLGERLGVTVRVRLGVPLAETPAAAV